MKQLQDEKLMEHAEVQMVEERSQGNTLVRDDIHKRTLKAGESGCFAETAMGEMGLPKSAFDKKKKKKKTQEDIVEGSDHTSTGG